MTDITTLSDEQIEASAISAYGFSSINPSGRLAFARAILALAEKQHHDEIARMQSNCDNAGVEIAELRAELDALRISDRIKDANCEALRAERDMAVEMLACWCVAVDENGTGWDDWDEHYKDAMYRPTPLRGLLDAAIAAARSKA